LLIDSFCFSAHSYLSQKEKAFTLCNDVEGEIKQRFLSSKDPASKELASIVGAELQITRARIAQGDAQKRVLELMHKNFSSIPVNCEMWETYFAAQDLIEELTSSDSNKGSDDPKVKKIDQLIDKAVAKMAGIQEERSRIKGDDTMSYLKQRCYYANKLSVPLLTFQKAISNNVSLSSLIG